MKSTKHMFVLRPWFIAAMVIGLIGGGIYEWHWQTRVEGGIQAETIVAWLRQNPTLKERVGDITSLNVQKSQTSFSTSLGGGSSGCYHYILSATHGPSDIWVTWHQDDGNHPLVLDKLEIDSNGARQTIWTK